MQTPPSYCLISNDSCGIKSVQGILNDTMGICRKYQDNCLTILGFLLVFGCAGVLAKRAPECLVWATRCQYLTSYVAEIAAPSQKIQHEPPENMCSNILSVICLSVHIVFMQIIIDPSNHKCDIISNCKLVLLHLAFSVFQSFLNHNFKHNFGKRFGLSVKISSKSTNRRLIARHDKDYVLHFLLIT